MRHKFAEMALRDLKVVQMVPDDPEEDLEAAGDTGGLAGDDGEEHISELKNGDRPPGLVTVRRSVHNSPMTLSRSQEAPPLSSRDEVSRVCTSEDGGGEHKNGDYRRAPMPIPPRVTSSAAEAKHPDPAEMTEKAKKQATKQATTRSTKNATPTAKTVVRGGVGGEEPQMPAGEMPEEEKIEEEKRMAPDGSGPYTLKEFVDYFGGEIEWVAASSSTTLAARDDEKSIHYV